MCLLGNGFPFFPLGQCFDLPPFALICINCCSLAIKFSLLFAFFDFCGLLFTFLPFCYPLPLIGFLSTLGQSTVYVNGCITTNWRLLWEWEASTGRHWKCNYRPFVDISLPFPRGGISYLGSSSGQLDFLGAICHWQLLCHCRFHSIEWNLIWPSKIIAALFHAQRCSSRNFTVSQACHLGSWEGRGMRKWLV